MARPAQVLLCKLWVRPSITGKSAGMMAKVPNQGQHILIVGLFVQYFRTSWSQEPFLDVQDLLFCFALR